MEKKEMIRKMLTCPNVQPFTSKSYSSVDTSSDSCPSNPVQASFGKASSAGSGVWNRKGACPIVVVQNKLEKKITHSALPLNYIVPLLIPINHQQRLKNE